MNVMNVKMYLLNKYKKLDA